MPSSPEVVVQCVWGSTPKLLLLPVLHMNLEEQLNIPDQRPCPGNSLWSLVPIQTPSEVA